VSKTTVQPVEELTWEGCAVGLLCSDPRLELAEQFASHERNGELVFKVSLDNTKT
jgi:hypothetical protein